MVEKEYTPLKLDPKLKEIVRQKAEQENRSISNYIETALKEKTGFKSTEIHSKKKEYGK